MYKENNEHRNAREFRSFFDASTKNTKLKSAKI
jgi:hypothetical protein